jgi:ubiquinol-cytochrome c reductase cytochrome b subunit
MPDRKLQRSLTHGFRLPRDRYRRVAGWIDNTTGGGGLIRRELRHIFPDDWSFFFGEIALYCFVILIATGVYMCLFFKASAARTVYLGSYRPLHGVGMSEAYASVLRLSFDVRAGLVIRQVHHWAALIFAAALALHLFRMFFTGAYRRPRRLNWVIGLTLLTLVFVNGVFGYSLPDDLLSGTGLRIAYSITQSIPLIGPNLASLLFGGDFPTTGLIPRIYAVHILLVPGAIAGLLGAHMGLLWIQRHTQYRGVGRSDRVIVGTPMVPAYALRTTGFLLVLTGMLTALGGFFQINPVWLYGPYQPWDSTSFAQPDWYTGWLEGAVRMTPAWDIHIGGFLLPGLFWPAAVLPGVIAGFLFMWPWLDGLVLRDNDIHNVLQTPRDRPGRTAIGAGILTFLIMLLLAGGDDVFAATFHWHLPTLLAVMQGLTLGLPFVVGGLAYAVFRYRHLAVADEVSP